MICLWEEIAFSMQGVSGLGLDELSASPKLMPLMKQTIRKLNRQDCYILAQEAFRLTSAKTIREYIHWILWGLFWGLSGSIIKFNTSPSTVGFDDIIDLESLQRILFWMDRCILFLLSDMGSVQPCFWNTLEFQVIVIDYTFRSSYNENTPFTPAWVLIRWRHTRLAL